MHRNKTSVRARGFGDPCCDVGILSQGQGTHANLRVGEMTEWTTMSQRVLSMVLDSPTLGTGGTLGLNGLGHGFGFGAWDAFGELLQEILRRGRGTEDLCRCIFIVANARSSGCQRKKLCTAVYLPNVIKIEVWTEQKKRESVCGTLIRFNTGNYRLCVCLVAQKIGSQKNLSTYKYGRH